MARLLLRVWNFVAHPGTRYVAAWLLTLGLAAHLQYKAYHDFDSRDKDPTRRRHDGNDGHMSIDFGGQWMMGRMLTAGYGRELYDRHRLYELAQRVYPIADETPATIANEPGAPPHDYDQMLSAFIDTEVNPRSATPRQVRERTTKQTFLLPLGASGPLDAIAAAAVAEDQYWKSDRLEELQRKHVGGPLYPPTHALIFAPLALDDNVRRAYHITQWVMLLAGFAAGLGVSVATSGRVWWPVATVLVMLYPGFTGDHSLGQNGPVSLAIIAWGWALYARGYETGGGLVWGLLAFKPVWAAAFLLAPLLTRRWRACAAMAFVGAAMVAASVPFVGVESWLDWLKIGRIANMTYNVDGNWIPLSRDLLGIPRRFLIDTDSVEYFERDWWLPHVIGWAIWLFVVELTVRLTQIWPKTFRATSGPAAGFVLLAAWLSCFHFMYYDVILSALGYLVLLDPPGELFRRRFFLFSGDTPGRGLDRSTIDYLGPRLVETHPELQGGGRAPVWVVNSLVMYFAVALFVVQTTMPWLDAGITITARRPFAPYTVTSAGEVLMKQGKPVVHTPKVEITTTTAGPPWDTFCLLFLWAWCGVRVAIAQLSAERKEAG